MLIDIFNAADPQQIDGVGGATSTTSKAAIISPAGVGDDVDVDYLFAQVGIGEGRVEWESNCGNCATAIALYAVSRGLVTITPGSTLVRMRNLNTGARLEADVATPDGTLPTFGEARVPGTLATGVPVTLAFLDAAGTATGGILLPTGHAQEELAVDGNGFHVSMIDAGAPMVLVDASDFGLTGAEDLTRIVPLVPTLTEIRSTAAVRMGLRTAAGRVNHAVPKVGIIGPASDYTTTSGEKISASSYDISVRTLSMHTPHPAIGLTSAVAIAAASVTPGTLVNLALAAGNQQAYGDRRLRIGTAAGVIHTTFALDASGQFNRIGLERAARIISESVIFTRGASATAHASI